MGHGRCALEVLEVTTESTLFGLCEELYPICRSITGDGVRQTLKALSGVIDLSVHEVPTGTEVFDWTVPKEWNLNRAYIVGPDGQRVVDTADHNLHVVNYSAPVQTRLSRSELDAFLHSLPDEPDLIPYRTTYFAETWGFCLSQKHRDALPEGEYEVVVDTTLKQGSLTYGEFYVPGMSDEDLLISTHICHPSLANDNLSGLSVATYLAQYFAEQPPGHFGLRFVFVPGTIGAITWLAQNPTSVAKISAGLVLSGVGDSGRFTYKKSRHGAGLFDRLFETRLQSVDGDAQVRPFLPYGYDERQYCSPGINIPAGCLMRTPYGEYPEYHSSGDNLELISASALQETFLLCRDVILDAGRVVNYLNLNPNCEPQLGRRGLYDNIGGDNQSKNLQLALLWLLSYSDGDHSTLDISDLSGMSLTVLAEAAQLLVNAQLLKAVGVR